MDYKDLYEQLIQLRKTEQLVKSKEQTGMIESHHILPRCCGGTDDLNNIVNLYAKEHFMAHYYLWKMHENDEFRYPLLNAFWMMCNMASQSQKRTYQEFVKMSEEYQQARVALAKYISETIPDKVKGEKNGAYGKHWYYDPKTNESHPYVDGQQPKGWLLGKKYKDPKVFSKAVSRGNKTRLKNLNGKKQFHIYNPTTGKKLILIEGQQIPEGFEKRGRPLTKSNKQKLSEYYKKKNAEIIAPKRIEELSPQYAYYRKYGWEKFKEY